MRDNGIVGVKLHPLFQNLSLDDPRVHEILAALAQEGMPVVTHVGAGEDEAANQRGAPTLLRQLADALPDLTLIACHYGGYHRLDEAEEHVVGSRVTLETSWPPTMAELDPERVVAIIRRHGADRVVYGSDWPMADPAAEMAAIRALPLTAEEIDGILGDNLARLLGLRDRMSGKVVRLGAGMAFWGDSVRPAIEMVERGEIDYLCCDHLAELTMSILAKQRATNPERGYTRDVIDLLRGALPACVEKGVKVVTNAGGANPRAAARAIRALADELGLPGVRIAVVLGDDIEDRIDDLDRRRDVASATSTPAPSSTRSATGSPTPRSTPAARGSSRRSTGAPTSSSAAG